MIKQNNIKIRKNTLSRSLICLLEPTTLKIYRKKFQNNTLSIGYSTIIKIDEKKTMVSLFLKKMILINHLIINVISLLSLLFINYTEKVRIYHEGNDVTLKVSICMCIVNLLLIGITSYKLRSEIIEWKIMIINTLLNLGNIFGITYILKLGQWCYNNYEEGIKLKYNYSIEYQWNMEEKIQYCHKIYEKYPQLLSSDKYKIINNLTHTRLNDIPAMIEKINEHRLLMIENMAKRIKEETITSNATYIYEQLENIKQMISSLFFGSYWYIGWGISISVGVLLIILYNKLQQPELCTKSDLDKLSNEINKLKEKGEDTKDLDKLILEIDKLKEKGEDTKDLEKYWEIVKKNPELLKEISSDIYRTPSMRIIKANETVVTYESQLDYTIKIKRALTDLRDRTDKIEKTLQEKGTSINDLQKDWKIIKKNPELLKEISADLYKAPIIEEINEETSTITYKSPLEYTRDTNDLIMESIHVNAIESDEVTKVQNELKTELHDLSVKYNELKKTLNKVQPTIDPSELKVGSGLINVAKNILEEFK